MGSHLKSLVVDDDAFSRRILQKMLSPFGDCDAVGDGLEAFHRFRAAHDEKDPYRLLTLDVELPGLSGHELLKQIREAEQKLHVHRNSDVAIIMVTGRATPESVRSAASDGQCDAYLVKPVERERLYQELIRLKLISTLDLPGSVTETNESG